MKAKVTKRPSTKVLPDHVRGSRNPHLLSGRVKFDKAQRRRLQSRGLSDAQINSLESRLGGITLSLRAGPTVTQQRNALKRMASALTEVEGAFGVPANLIDIDGLGMALRKRLDDAHRSDREYSDDARALLKLTCRMKFTLGAALSDIQENAQSRQRTAGYWPVKLIDDALQPHTLRGEAFRDVCGIAYEAAAGVQIDPERAIKTYRKHLGTAARMK